MPVFIQRSAPTESIRSGNQLEELWFETRNPENTPLARISRSLLHSRSFDNQCRFRNRPGKIEMNPVSTSLESTRRSTAIGIWSLAIAVQAFVPAEVPLLVSLLILSIVSAANSLAILCLRQWATADRLTNRRQQQVAGTVSSAVTLAWVLLLGGRESLPVLAIYVVFAVGPVMLTSFASLHFHVQSLVETSPRFGVKQSETTRRTPSLLALVEDIDTTRDQSFVTDIAASEEEFLEEEYESDCDISRLKIDQTVAANVTQWLTRSLTVDGENIAGGVRVDFVTGQREATIHVSFCPPLTTIPNLTTEDLDGIGLEIRVAATFLFGARFSVRRPLNSMSTTSPLPAESCRIAFVAIAESVRRAA